jgi:hypothetical protein
MAGVAGIKPTLAELEAAVLSLHQTPRLALPRRFERHPTGSQPACSLPSSIGSMVPNARVDRAWRPYESRLFAGRIGMAAALGVEPSCPASKARILAGGAASNWCSVTVSIRRLRFEGPRCSPLHQRSMKMVRSMKTGADARCRPGDLWLEARHVAVTPRPRGRPETRSPHRCRCRILSRERRRLAG